MTLVPKTILRKIEPYLDPTDPNGEDLTPYNEISVIGPSDVIANGGRREEWSGQQSDQISVSPTSFGPVKIMFQGELEEDYEIVEFPPENDGLGIVAERPKLGPSAEEQFRRVDNPKARRGFLAPKTKAAAAG